MNAVLLATSHCRLHLSFVLCLIDEGSQAGQTLAGQLGALSLHMRLLPDALSWELIQFSFPDAVSVGGVTVFFHIFFSVLSSVLRAHEARAASGLDVLMSTLRTELTPELTWGILNNLDSLRKTDL